MFGKVTDGLEAMHALKQGDKKKAMFFARKALGEDAQLPEAQELFKRAE